MNKYKYGYSFEKLFWKKVDKSGECWEWTGCKDRNGYGWKCFMNKKLYAHRVSWELAHGREIPEGLVVAHHCDNPACVNPDHLFLGTQGDNVRDCWRKGRANNEGENASRHKLSEKDVLEIRKLGAEANVDEGGKMKFCYALAEKYSVTHYTIFDILNRRSWTHI